MKSSIPLMLLIFPFGSLKFSLTVDDWCWTWVCQQEYCIRKDGILKLDANVTTFISQDECRLVCNRFSTLWPRPTGLFEISRKTVTVHPDGFFFDFKYASEQEETRDFLKHITDNFVDSLRTDCPNAEPCDLLIFVTIEIDEYTLTLNWNNDESYTLNVDYSDNEQIKILVKANSVFGARHAFESLHQLTVCHNDENDYLVMMDKVVLTDKPLYSHRGLLLDSSRHFLSEKSIQRTLKAMAMAKMNVLHWHLTDSQSFSFYSESVPELTKYGAFSKDFVYTPDMVNRIVQFARFKGIRVIAEVDGPGHAAYGWQWGPSAGLGDLAVCINAQPWKRFCLQPPCGQLNPTNQEVYGVLKKLYGDVQTSFPSDMFHMGGDEVHFPCWKSDENIISWMENNGLKVTDDGFFALWNMFNNKSLAVWDEAAGHSNTSIIVWTSRLTDPKHIEMFLDKGRYIIQSWMDSTDQKQFKLLKMGYKMIMSPQDKWYLDHGFWDSTRYHRWDIVYDNQIPGPQYGVYGGEACMWSERVSEYELDSRVWPRTSCLAERLWADPAESSREALPRLATFNTRLLRRGIRTEMIQDEWCSQNDGLCGDT